MARKSKYTPEAEQKICQAIRVGATYEHAAASAGIAYETFRVWRDTYPAFSAAIKKAEGEFVVLRLARISKAGDKGTWQADAWALERRFPQDYGRTVQDHNVDMKVTGDITLYLPKKGDK